MKNRFDDPSETSDVQTMRVSEIRAEQREAEQAGCLSPVLTIGILLQAKARLASDKSGGSDGMVSEMVSSLPVSVLYLLLFLFRERLAGESSESILTWSTVLLFFIQKPAAPTQAIQNYRVISVTTALSKLYMASIMIMTSLTPYPPQWNRILVGGGRGIGPDYIILISKLMVEKAYEWPEPHQFILLNGDVLHAFDSLHPRESLATLKQWGIHPSLRAAVAQEMCSLIGHGSFENLPLRITISKCIKQGTVEAAIIFNATMLSILAPLDTWFEAGLGVQFAHTSYRVLVWADNVWLFANTVREAAIMA